MRRSALLALLVAGVILVPAAVYASHQFTDVPNSHTFHNAIDWMKDNNITVGCNPPANNRYCPDDNVTRGQMAAFMKRLAENQVVDAATLGGVAPGGYTNPSAGARSANVALPLATVVELAELPIAAPSAGGLVINASLYNVANNTSGQATFWLQADNGTCTFDVANFYSIIAGRYQVVNPGFGTSPGVVGTAAVTAGPHTVTLCARTFDGGPLSTSASLTAQFVTSLTRAGALQATPSSGDASAGEPTS